MSTSTPLRQYIVVYYKKIFVQETAVVNSLLSNYSGANRSKGAATKNTPALCAVGTEPRFLSAKIAEKKKQHKNPFKIN